MFQQLSYFQQKQLKKIQGYDNVDYKQVNRFVTHASFWLKAYEDKITKG
jgi:hypothetical protein